jgi:DnaJ-class molecular chaperone
VSAAYDLRRDPERRGRIARGEIDASGQARPQPRYSRDFAGAEGGERYHSAAGYEDMSGMSDILNEIFGRRAAAGFGGGEAAELKVRGQDLRYHLDVDFLDAVNGAARRVTLPDGAALELTIPPGTADGATLRLRGKGGAGLNGGPPGDALVSVTVTPHPVFRREDDAIDIDLPIGIDEAVLGGKVDVPTISGQVRMTVPKGSSSGDTLRLRGKGVVARGRKAGDQRVVLKIVAPDRADPELEALLEGWKGRGRQNPRDKLRRAS